MKKLAWVLVVLALGVSVGRCSVQAMCEQATGKNCPQPGVDRP